MVEGLSKINYKGKEILYLDYSIFAKDKTTQKEKTLKLMEAANTEYKKYPEHTALGLGNFKDFHFDMDVLNALKKSQNEVGCYMRKTAILGVQGLLKAGYNFVIGLTDKKTKAFSSEQEAKEWLVSEAD